MSTKRRSASPLIAASIVRPAHEVKAAKREFRRLDRAAQFNACREIAETRSAELVLAYRNLVSVGFGYKTRRLYSNKSEHVDVRHPCIVFVVARKWRSKKNVGNPQHLPEHLFTYITSGEGRLLCAVPTDVTTLSKYGRRSRPHADPDETQPYGVVVRNGGRETWGVVACAVEREGQGHFALSCRHVFSMTLSGQEKASGCTVAPAGNHGLLGTTWNVRGPLVAEPVESFDAQLAKVSDPDALRASLSGLRFDPVDPIVRDPSEVPTGFYIQTPRAGNQGSRLKVWMGFRTMLSVILPYGSVNAVHHYIIHAVANEPLKSGDSGSPAVPVAAGGKLVGMYIGGDGTNAYIIPAWQLVQGGNYGLTKEKLWRVVNP